MEKNLQGTAARVSAPDGAATGRANTKPSATTSAPTASSTVRRSWI